MLSSDLLKLADSELLSYWEECHAQTCVPGIRGWYQELYASKLAGKCILDIGPGLGFDGICFAQNGAKVVFADIVEENLRLLERICRLKNIEAETYYIKDFFEYDLNERFDVLLCVGSLINAPFDFARRQVAALAGTLKDGGKVLFLGYPKERFLRSGAKDGAGFGKTTDGPNTPWVEWYDAPKIRQLFGESFRLDWGIQFGADRTEFNWFELTKTAAAQSRTVEPVISARTTGSAPTMDRVKTITLDMLRGALGYGEEFSGSNRQADTPMDTRRMDRDDMPILRYLYRNHRPARHLEFGTWQGDGAIACLEECDATIWTINLPFGEKSKDGGHAYGRYPEDADETRGWAQRVGIAPQKNHCTDTLGFIGRRYLEKDMGNRVCQILCDSRMWDTQNYPKGFFDSVLIDGSHEKTTVISDTAKAISLLRSGGLLLWHDYCPPLYRHAESVKGVMDALRDIGETIFPEFKALYWIQPSWLLLGIKR